MSESASRKDLTLGLIYGAVFISIFTSFVLVSRIGMRTDLQAGDLLALRFGIGGLILAPVFWRFGLNGVGLRDAIALAALGGLGFALLAYEGIARTPATHASVFLHGALPLTTMVIAAAYWRRWPNRTEMLGIAAIAAGVAAMAWDSVAEMDPSRLVGDGMLFAAATSWSGYAIWVKVRNISALQAAAIVAVLSGVVYLPFYAVLGRSQLFDASVTDLLLQALFQGVAIGVISLFAYTRASELLGSVRAALLTTIVPTATTLLAIPMLGEWPSTVVSLGVVLTTAGMVLALAGNQRE